MIFYTTTTQLYNVVTKRKAARIILCDHTSIEEVCSEACSSMWGSVSTAKPERDVQRYEENPRGTCKLSTRSR